jgi:hypothetical protein
MEETLNLFIKLPNREIMLRNSERTTAINFSDSILIFTKNDSSDDLHSIFISSTGFFAKALQRCVPLRGAISSGRFYFNFEKNLFCGPPLLSAHELAESAQWSGIIVDVNVVEQYRRNPITSNSGTAIIRWSVSVKGKTGGRKGKLWVLNWPLICKENFKVEVPISPQLYSKAFQSLFKSSYEEWPKDIQVKYDNTVEFTNSTLATNGK